MRPPAPPVALLSVALLAGCGLLPSQAPTPTQIQAPALLPGEDELMPAGADGVGGWHGTSSFPGGFDPSPARPTAEAVGEALAAALADGYAGSAEVPTYDLASFSESEGRVVLVLSELGVGDDSVLGSQYALVIDASADGWRLAELYARPICRRGLSGGFCV